MRVTKKVLIELIYDGQCMRFEECAAKQLLECLKKAIEEPPETI